MEHVDTELHEAVRYGDTNLVESALNDGLDPNSIGLYQWSPLHEAACNGDIDVLKLLLEAKGNPNAPDNLHGYTATHYAAKEGHADCLQLLVDYGGRYDVTNNEGETPLDIAEGKCKQILEIQSTGDYISQTLRTSRQLSSNTNYTSTEDASQKDRHQEKADLHTPIRTKPTTQDETESGTPASIFSPRGTNTPTAWDHIEVLDRTDTVEAGTGLLQLSFEYNSNKSTLKIRVWQVEDLLLPPLEFANINRLYVKSRLLPDKKGDSKRRTEEHRIDDQTKMKNSLVTLKRKKDRDTFKAIFLPYAFKFTKPLEYKKITKDIVANSTVHIDVCAKQKYSTKSFPIANIQMSLKSAVRKLRKTYHQLHPCINYTMPDNIHVYDPKDLVIVTEGMYSNTIVSQPNLRALSRHNLREEKQRRTNSDINLRAVRTQSVESIPSVVLDVQEDRNTADGDLQGVSVIDSRYGIGEMSHSDSNVTIVHVGEASIPGSTDDELEEVTVVSPRKGHSRSTPDVTESTETSFINQRPNKFKLHRPSTPEQNLTGNKHVPRTKFQMTDSTAVEPLQVKVEPAPRTTRIAKQNPTPKQAAEDLHEVTVDSQTRTFQRKGKDNLAFIELEHLQGQRHRLQTNQRPQRSVSPSGRVSAPTMRVTGVVAKPLRLSVPEIKIVDTDGNIEPTTVISIDKDQSSGHKKLYQKRKMTSNAAKPGRVVDLRIKGDSQGTTKIEAVTSPRSSSAHEEELIIGHVEAGSEKKKEVKYSEVIELDSRHESSSVKDSKKTRSENTGETGRSRKDQMDKTLGDYPKHSEPRVGSRVADKKVVDKLKSTFQGQQPRIKSPKSVNQETSFTIRQQDFPQSLTQGMMHTELNSTLSSMGRKSSKYANQSRSPDIERRVDLHYESETPDVSPRLSKHKRVDQKGQPIKVPSQRVSSSSAVEEIELDPVTMATPEFKLKAFQRTSKDPQIELDPVTIATPEFKLKAFQRTSKDPHPSTPFLHKTESKIGLDDTQLERIDPFFVPGTPLQSPISQIGSPAQVNSPLRDRSPSPRRRRIGVVSVDQSKTGDSHNHSSSSNKMTSLQNNENKIYDSDVRSKMADKSKLIQRNGKLVSSGIVNPNFVIDELEIGSIRTERSKSPEGAGKKAASHVETNNNGVRGKSDDKPMQNPSVIRIKQSWLR